MPDAANIRAMVVDDQPPVRLLLRNGLQRAGITEIDEYPDGEAALNGIIAQPVHLIISDFNMPKLDGMGLLRAIRAHPLLGAIPFIMLTGYSDAELASQAIQNGATDCLVKPFRIAALKEKIEAIIAKLT